MPPHLQKMSLTINWVLFGRLVQNLLQILSNSGILWAVSGKDIGTGNPRDSSQNRRLRAPKSIVHFQAVFLPTKTVKGVRFRTLICSQKFECWTFPWNFYSGSSRDKVLTGDRFVPGPTLIIKKVMKSHFSQFQWQKAIISPQGCKSWGKKHYWAIIWRLWCFESFFLGLKSILHVVQPSLVLISRVLRGRGGLSAAFATTRLRINPQTASSQWITL